MINLDLHDIRKSFYDYNRDNNQITIEFPFLNKDSIVLDLGGYKGDWASDIYSKYLCNIEVFEPIPKFYNNIKKRFINNSKIKSFNVGAYSTNTDIDMILDKDGSSIYKQSKTFIWINSTSPFTLKECNFINRILYIKSFIGIIFSHC